MARYRNLTDKDGSPRLFGKRPYCSKEARDRLNRESREIFMTEPEYVDDPENPSLDEVLKHIQKRESLDDADLIVDLLANGLGWEEVIVYYLFRWSGLEKREIYYATEGIRTAPDVEDRGLTRHIDRVLASVEEKLGEDLLDDDVDAIDGESETAESSGSA